MPLTSRERTGSRRLLELLDTTDLFSLAGTVTHRESTACTRAEAIDTILQNSKNASELLNRKKVLRDIIAAYLKNEGVEIPSKITKAYVVQKTLAYWSEPDFSVTDVRTFTPSSTSQQSKASGSNSSYPSYLYTSESPIQSPLEDTSKTRKSRISTTDLDEISKALSHINVRDHVSSPPIRTQEKVSLQKKVSRDVFSAKTSKSSCLKEEGKEQRWTSQPQSPQAGLHITTRYMQTERTPVKTEPKTGKVEAASCRGAMYDSKHRVPSSTVTKGEKDKLQPLPSPVSGQNSRRGSQLPALHQSAHVKRNTREMTSPYSAAKEVEDASGICPVNFEQFAKDFCEWFFKVLNSQQQSSRLQRKDWGPQHFLEDAELQLTSKSSRGRYSGRTRASSRLLALVQEEGLFFQPNISRKDLKCELSPQGDMVVMVSGTIFRNKSYLGTFDQVFEVVGNSRTNNWKIRYVELKIQECS